MEDYEKKIEEYKPFVTVLEVPRLFEKTGLYGAYYAPKGSTKKYIFLEYGQSSVDKDAILVEEFKHYLTSVGVILNQESSDNKRQESLARNLSYKELVTLDDLINCYEHGLTQEWEVAEELQLSQEVLHNAINYFKSAFVSEFNYPTKHGTYRVTIGSTINFYKLPNSEVN